MSMTWFDLVLVPTIPAGSVMEIKQSATIIEKEEQGRRGGEKSEVEYEMT